MGITFRNNGQGGRIRFRSLGLGGRFASSFFAPAAPFVGLLDTYPNAAAAYSLRKLRTAYSGAAIRVRRSSDNAEQDIGFDGSGNLDETALTSFVGAASGFVTTWYDQSGNNQNATQTTQASQPRIVNAGTIDRQNGKPAIFYDGTNDRFATNIQTMDLNSGDNISCFTVIRTSVTNSFRDFISKFNGTPGQASLEDGWGFRITNTGVFSSYFAKDAVYSTTSTTTTEVANMQRLATFFANGGSLTTNVNIFGNGTEFGYTRAGTTTTLDNTNYVINIGAGLYNNTYSEHWSGTMQEIVLYNSDRRTDRTAIESNINTYYAIY